MTWLNPIPVFFNRDPGQAGDYPRNELNDAYNELTTTYSAIRDIKNVTSELENAGLVLGTDFEKIENARLLVIPGIYLTMKNWVIFP